MNTATHTPTPWKVALRKDNRVPNRIVTETPVYPGAVNPAEIARVVERNDCAFIVRACNAHDELVAALKTLADLADASDGGNKIVHMLAISDGVKAARAALAKAGA